MALFGKLFEKKVCVICGGEIGLLGNRKLEDGNMCKNCAKKLSPWFDDRRHSTVAQINEQLAYREKNREALESFQVSRTFGIFYKVYVEEKDGVPTRFFVTDAQDYMAANPDIMDFRDVVSCVEDVQSSRRELKQKNANGEMVSYNPPRYEYMYNFYIKMQIRDNPYFDDIRFGIHTTPARVTQTEMGRSSGLGDMLFGVRNAGPEYDPDYQKYHQICQQIIQVVEDGKRAPAAAPVTVAEEAPQPAAPKFCPGCGSPADGGKFCQYCGTKLM